VQSPISTHALSPRTPPRRRAGSGPAASQHGHGQAKQLNFAPLTRLTFLAAASTATTAQASCTLAGAPAHVPHTAFSATANSLRLPTDFLFLPLPADSRFTREISPPNLV